MCNIANTIHPIGRLDQNKLENFGALGNTCFWAYALKTKAQKQRNSFIDYFYSSKVIRDISDESTFIDQSLFPIMKVFRNEHNPRVLLSPAHICGF